MIRVNQAMATTETRPARRAIPAWLLWGTAIGLVQIFAIATVQPLGVSTAYPQFVGFVVEKLVPGFGASQPYLQKIGTAIGWEVMLVMGIPIGALLSRLLAGEVKRECNCLRAAQLLEQFAVPGSCSVCGWISNYFWGTACQWMHERAHAQRDGPVGSQRVPVWSSCLHHRHAHSTPADEAQQPCPRR
jgi:hypothetical protein